MFKKCYFSIMKRLKFKQHDTIKYFDYVKTKIFERQTNNEDTTVYKKHLSNVVVKN